MVSADGTIVKPQDLASYPEPTTISELMTYYSEADEQVDLGSKPQEDQFDKISTLAKGQKTRDSNLQIVVQRIVSLVLDCAPDGDPIYAPVDNQLQGQMRTLNRETLQDNLKVNADQKAALQESYEKFLTGLQELSSDLDLTHLYRGRSAVFSYDLANIHLTKLNFDILEKVNNRYPVQLISTEADADGNSICTRGMGKRFVAQCQNMTNFLTSDDLAKINPDGKRQTNNLIAMLISNTAEKVFVSPTSSLLISPSQMMALADPYDSGRLILWPNTSAYKLNRMAHPSFYDMTGKEIGLRSRVASDEYLGREFLDELEPDSHKIPFHDMNGTISESYSTSDTVLIDMRYHFKTVVLALYLSVYEDWYVAMVMQGTSGKLRDTYQSDLLKIAATLLDMPFYQVKTPRVSAASPPAMEPSIVFDFFSEYSVIRWYKESLQDPAFRPENYKTEEFLKYFSNSGLRRLKMNTFIQDVSLLLNPIKLYRDDGYRDRYTRSRRRVLDHPNIVMMAPTLDYELEYFNHAYTAQSCAASPTNSKNRKNPPGFWSSLFSSAESPKKSTLSRAEHKAMCKDMDEHIQFLREHPRSKSASV